MISPSPAVQGGFGAVGGSEHGGSQSDNWVEEDDTEMALQNTINRLERLILKSRVGKAETPRSSSSVAASAGAGGGTGDSAAGAAAGAASAAAAAGAGGSRSPPKRPHGLSIGGRMASSRSRLRAPLTDRPSMPSRRQSTSFFDTKPLHSARDSGGSFSKAWDAMGEDRGRGSSDAGAGDNGIKAVEGNEDRGVKRRPVISKTAHSRAQSEGWRADRAVEDGGVGTPPTVEGSTESSNGSPSDRWGGWDSEPWEREGVAEVL